MNKKQIAAAEKTLLQFIGAIVRGEVKWYAISVRYNSGATFAIHSDGAPNRPQGIRNG